MASPTSSDFDKLPKDVLSEVLQLLPAKELCRLRTVCKSWRSVTAEATFIRAHAYRHKEPLFIAKFWDDETHVYIVDLSGNVVKRIAGAHDGHQVQRTRLNLACLAAEWNTSCGLLNPATGRMQILPGVPALHHVEGFFFRNPCTFFFALGLVASTGEYKVMRCWHRSAGIGHEPEVQVLTISNGGTEWRPRLGPSGRFVMHSGIVVEGVVYFLRLRIHYTVEGYAIDGPSDDIVSFDLAREEWRRDLRGPLSTGNVTSAEDLWGHFNLADLKGSLVLAHCRRHLMSTVDLWFLLDFESEHWVKEYSIQTESVTSRFGGGHVCLIPLLALHDGRLVFYVAQIGLLFICDPGTNTFTRVHMRHRLDSVGVYTGSLLSLQDGAMV